MTRRLAYWAAIAAVWIGGGALLYVALILAG